MSDDAALSHDAQALNALKRADANHPVLDLIARRWSPRAFADRSVAHEHLGSIFEAARWAPSSRNEQPWRFIMATKREPEAYERLLSCLKESNQEWAKQAPVLLLTVAKKHFAQGDALNRYAWHDVGMATANLVLQALALGIYAHPMAGIYPDRAQAELGIPESYEPVTAIALGYRGELSTLPERRREAEQRPRTRRPLTEMVFIGRWGKAAAFLEAPDDRHW